MNQTTLKDMLVKLNQLNNLSELNQEEAESWEAICNSPIDDDGTPYCDDIREGLLYFLDEDKELVAQIKDFLNDTGVSIQEIAFGGVAVGLYLLQKLFPTNYNYDHFGEFWIDTCRIDDRVIDSIDSAINRAVNRWIAEEERTIQG